MRGFANLDFEEPHLECCQQETGVQGRAQRVFKLCSVQAEWMHASPRQRLYRLPICWRLAVWSQPPKGAPLQDSFWDRIQGARNSELGVLWRTAIVASFNAFLLNAIPVIVSVATFTAYVLLGHNLTAAKAFTALSLFTVSCLQFCHHQLRSIHPVCTPLRDFSCCASFCSVI